jgi:hypothetical protein
MLESVRGSLRDYPHSGGDIVVMQEVDRLRKDAVHEWAYDQRMAEVENRAI